MDLNLWRMGKELDVPAGKPMIIDGGVFLRMPSIHEDAPELALNISEKGCGSYKTLGPSQCLFFTGSIRFEATSAAALLTAKHRVGEDSAGCIVIGEHGAFAVGGFKAEYDLVYYGVNALGELLTSAQLDSRVFRLTEWNLIGLDASSNTTVLASVQMQADE